MLQSQTSGVVSDSKLNFLRFLMSCSYCSKRLEFKLLRNMLKSRKFAICISSQVDHTEINHQLIKLFFANTLSESTTLLQHLFQMFKSLEIKQKIHYNSNISTLKPNIVRYTPTNKLYANESAKKKACAKLPTVSVGIAGGHKGVINHCISKTILSIKDLSKNLNTNDCLCYISSDKNRDLYR
ncbi:hypothetical protein AGLY_015332 [Aphis glycines]|uniref:Uncharacterized protein n=1 Tax=Aphis glycines TaxID=307491 RepID=A0A6G0T0Y5_APHGL|nr:hypothetical protein AGLY_015332 [Aphis glycines]